MDRLGDYHTKCSKSDKNKDKYHLPAESKKMIQTNLLTKQKQTHKHRKQTYDYQRGKGRWGGIN